MNRVKNPAPEEQAQGSGRIAKVKNQMAKGKWGEVLGSRFNVLGSEYKKTRNEAQRTKAASIVYLVDFIVFPYNE